ncbi:multidrug resistance protein homolog 65-like [Drosophila miranda]|uniref:multidrug resistance protein homolog 65-like n=1 Tax=Drosophila miranda TaxID=7229 RepID=UPI00143F76EE|nr:multidrug resistance protein homolog 65-like [Drosophila miranda]XP_033254847.1 multidrug resistance protein homolog 65-like isoform X1 [Drosophila miranda]XP_033255703.1 multidrug resistance protein homolog 65-like [Drosophila miranda]
MDEASGTTTTDGKSLDEAPVAAGLEPTQPIGFLQLFRFSTCGEIAWLFFGFLMCCVKALTLPAVVIIYSEFTAVSTGRWPQQRRRVHHSHGDPEHPSHRGERPAADHHDNGQWLRAQ